MTLRCETCRHWQPWERNDFGDCRINPPVMGDLGRGKWPGTHALEWCGEHEERLELPVVEG